MPLTTLIGIMATTYTAAVADSTISPWLAVYGAAPCMLAMVVMGWTVAAPPSAWRIAHMGAVGLIFDFNSGGHIGVGMACFALLASAILLLRVELRRFGPFELAVLTFPAVSALLLLVAAGNSLLGQLPGPPAVLLMRIVLAGVYTAAVSLPLWMVLDWLRDARRDRRALATR